MNPPTLSLKWHERTFTEGFTQSELSLFDECALKHNFRYNNLLTRSDTMNWNFWVGGAWHSFQQKWREQKGNIDLAACYFPEIPKEVIKDSTFDQTLDYWMAILPIYQIAYARLFAHEAKEDYFIIEKELKTEFNGFEIRGKIDLASDKKRNTFIRDFKTTKAAWMLSKDGWHFKLQFMLYSWLMLKNYPEWRQFTFFNFQMDIMQKPALKQTKSETWPAHIERVKADILARAEEHYFQRSTAPMTAEAIDRFEKQVILPKVNILNLIRDNPEDMLPVVTNPNTNACNAYNSQCEFFNVCDKGWGVAKGLFATKKAKHEELD